VTAALGTFFRMTSRASLLLRPLLIVDAIRRARILAMFPSRRTRIFAMLTRRLTIFPNASVVRLYRLPILQIRALLASSARS